MNQIIVEIIKVFMIQFLRACYPVVDYKISYFRFLNFKVLKLLQLFKCCQNNTKINQSLNLNHIFNASKNIYAK